MLCYKDYFEGGSPVDERDTEALRFGEHSSLVPTLVLENPEDGEASFGLQAKAEAERNPGLLRSGFKMDLALLDLEDPEEETRERAERAKELTKQFLRTCTKHPTRNSRSLSGPAIARIKRRTSGTVSGISSGRGSRSPFIPDLLLLLAASG